MTHLVALVRMWWVEGHRWALDSSKISPEDEKLLHAALHQLAMNGLPHDASSPQLGGGCGHHRASAGSRAGRTCGGRRTYGSNARTPTSVRRDCTPPHSPPHPAPKWWPGA